MFNSSDYNKLPCLITQLIDNSSLRKKLSLNGTKTGLEQSWKCILQVLIITYQDVIYSKQGNCKRIV